jgi:hypothetical protein
MPPIDRMTWAVTLFLICKVAWTAAGISRIDLLFDGRSLQPMGIERSQRLYHNGIIPIRSLPGANNISVAIIKASSVNRITECFNIICNW